MAHMHNYMYMQIDGPGGYLGLIREGRLSEAYTSNYIN